MKTTMKHKFFNSPLTRIILGLTLCFAAFIIAQQLVGKILDFTFIDKSFRNLIKGVVASLFVILTYVLFYLLVLLNISCHINYSLSCA